MISHNIISWFFSVVYRKLYKSVLILYRKNEILLHNKKPPRGTCLSESFINYFLFA